MSRSIFRCFSSCFRFALAAMAAAPREEAGGAGSRAALRRGPAVPRAALAAAAALRQRAPPAPDLAAAAAPLDRAGRGAGAAERGRTGPTTGRAGTTAPPPPLPPPPSRLLQRGKDEAGGRQEEARPGRPQAKCRPAPPAGQEESLRPRRGPSSGCGTSREDTKVMVTDDRSYFSPYVY